jgi:hypothetical protein
VIFINQLKLIAMTSSLVMQILAGAQQNKIKLPNCPFLKISISSQQFKISVRLTLSLHKSYQINKKNDWINIFLHYEFAQNELEVRNKSFCNYLSVS